MIFLFGVLLTKVGKGPRLLASLPCALHGSALGGGLAGWAPLLHARVAFLAGPVGRRHARR
jgi:hypothetical protein